VVVVAANMDPRLSPTTCWTLQSSRVAPTCTYHTADALVSRSWACPTVCSEAPVVVAALILIHVHKRRYPQRPPGDDEGCHTQTARAGPNSTSGRASGLDFSGGDGSGGNGNTGGMSQDFVALIALIEDIQNHLEIGQEVGDARFMLSRPTHLPLGITVTMPYNNHVKYPCTYVAFCLCLRSDDILYLV